MADFIKVIGDEQVFLRDEGTSTLTAISEAPAGAQVTEFGALPANFSVIGITGERTTTTPTGPFRDPASLALDPTGNTQAAEGTTVPNLLPDATAIQTAGGQIGGSAGPLNQRTLANVQETAGGFLAQAGEQATQLFGQQGAAITQQVEAGKAGLEAQRIAAAGQFQTRRAEIERAQAGAEGALEAQAARLRPFGGVSTALAGFQAEVGSRFQDVLTSLSAAEASVSAQIAAGKADVAAQGLQLQLQNAQNQLTTTLQLYKQGIELPLQLMQAGIDAERFLQEQKLFPLQLRAFDMQMEEFKKRPLLEEFEVAFNVWKGRGDINVVPQDTLNRMRQIATETGRQSLFDTFVRAVEDREINSVNAGDTTVIFGKDGVEIDRIVKAVKPSAAAAFLQNIELARNLFVDPATGNTVRRDPKDLLPVYNVAEGLYGKASLGKNMIFVDYQMEGQLKLPWGDENNVRNFEIVFNSIQDSFQDFQSELGDAGDDKKKQDRATNRFLNGMQGLITANADVINQFTGLGAQGFLGGLVQQRKLEKPRPGEKPPEGLLGFTLGTITAGFRQQAIPSAVSTPIIVGRPQGPALEFDVRTEEIVGWLLDTEENFIALKEITSLSNQALKTPPTTFDILNILELGAFGQ